MELNMENQRHLLTYRFFIRMNFVLRRNIVYENMKRNNLSEFFC